MAQNLHKKLDAGESFPRLELKFTDGSTKSTADLHGRWCALLIYRGGW